MYISTLANVVNPVGNIIGVFVLKLGVCGGAYPDFTDATCYLLMYGRRPVFAGRNFYCSVQVA